jgi:hypothetical protein
MDILPPSSGYCLFITQEITICIYSLTLQRADFQKTEEFHTFVHFVQCVNCYING